MWEMVTRSFANIPLTVRLALGALLATLFVLMPVAPALGDTPGFALAFDGSSNYVELGDTGDLFGGDSWASAKTISVWINPTAATSPATSPMSGELIVGNDFPHTFGISRSTYNGADRIWVWNSSSTSIRFIGIAFTPGEWIQVTLVHDGSTLFAYKNGALVGSLPSESTFIPGGSGDGSLYVGGSGRSNPAYYFQGEVDELRLWNVALDATTLQEWTYNEVTAAHPAWSDLDAYYQMSDESGTSLSDDSDNDNGGTLLGGMDDDNWVTSGALADPSATATPSPTPGEATPTPTPTSTDTPQPPTPTPDETATPTPTAEPPTPTPTPVDTATPTPTLASGGSAGYALQFDGNNDYVELQETANMIGSGWETEKTVSLWVKPTGTADCTAGSPAHCDAVLGDRPRWWGISRGTIGSSDRFWLWNFDGNMDVVPVDYTVGEWVHLALVHEGGTLRAYKNGVEVGSTPSGATMQPNTGALPILHLGGIVINASRNWTLSGQIDEVRIWNRARTAAEIGQDMYGPIDSASSGLMAYYQMSDGSGLVLSDDGQYGWDGTLHDGREGVVEPDGQPPQWVSSDAFTPPDATPTPTPIPTDTPTITPTPTDTPVPPTPTNTPVPPTPTNTPTPTDTPEGATPTPTDTPVPPTPTNTPVPPTPTATPSGDTNYALDFDGGDDYLYLGDTGDLMGGDGWLGEKTISVWIRPSVTAGPEVPPASGELIVGTHRPRTFGITRALYNGADRIWIWNVDDNGTDYISVDFVPGEWVQITMVHDAGVLYAYVNGELAGSIASGETYIPFPAADGSLYVAGNGRPDPTNHFDGQVDEVRFWNVALDAATIAGWTYQEIQSSHPQWANLMAYYQMSDGAGTTVTDDSDRDNEGALYGAMDDADWVDSGALTQ